MQLGFLYLRYVGNPKGHWEWIQPYVRDDEVGAHICGNSCFFVAVFERGNASCILKADTGVTFTGVHT